MAQKLAIKNLKKYSKGLPNKIQQQIMKSFLLLLLLSLFFLSLPHLEVDDSNSGKSKTALARILHHVDVFSYSSNSSYKTFFDNNLRTRNFQTPKPWQTREGILLTNLLIKNTAFSRTLKSFNDSFIRGPHPSPLQFNEVLRI